MASGVAAPPAGTGAEDPPPDRDWRRAWCGEDLVPPLVPPDAGERGEGDSAPLLVPPEADAAAREWPALDPGLEPSGA